MRHTVAFLLAALFCSSSFAQAPASGKKGGAPPQTTCDAGKKKAWSEGWQLGWKQGFKAGSLFSWKEGLAGFSTTLPVAGKQLKIELFAPESIQEGDSYRLAAAEVIRTHFPDRLVVVPDSPLRLSVTGASAGPAITLTVKVEMGVEHRVVVADGEVRLLWGSLVLADSSIIQSGYTVETRTQIVRESTYKVISEFLKKWQEAPKSPESPEEERPVSPPKSQDGTGSTLEGSKNAGRICDPAGRGR